MKRVALITGASAGLGVDFARQLSAKGHDLVLVARRSDRLESLAAELGHARAVAMDLSRPGSAGRLIDNLSKHDETCDLLINNAGFGLVARFADSEPETLRRMIDLNVGALTDLARAVLPAMIERGSGAILNVASTAAFQPGPGMAVYFATKAYVLSFSEALHEEVLKHGIKVTALCPGPTRTEFGEVAGFKAFAAMERLTMQSAPVVRIGLDALESNRAVAIAGPLNKVGAITTRFVPRAFLRKIAGAIKF